MKDDDYLHAVKAMNDQEEAKALEWWGKVTTDDKKRIFAAIRRIGERNDKFKAAISLLAEYGYTMLAIKAAERGKEPS